MKILAIDTSTKFLCLGIYDEGKIYEYNLEVGIKLSGLLFPTIRRVLAAASLDIRKIDYFACGLGPGSFTGMRVGISAVKGVSWALNKPVIGISTLDILAQNAKDSDKKIVPIIDAKRGLIYSCVYRKEKGRLKRSTPYMLLSGKALLRKIKSNALFFGDAVNLYKEDILLRCKGAEILDKDYWYPQARNIIKLALKGIREKRAARPQNLKPIYLYAKECQIKGKRQNVKGKT